MFFGTFLCSVPFQALAQDDILDAIEAELKAEEEKKKAAKEHHKEAYKQVVDYYEQALNIDIDTSGSDICRLCFVSYDEDCFINTNADIFKVIIKPKELTPPIKRSDQVTNNIEAYISEIEQTATDITGNYETWRNLGFAISEEYGEIGREYYHRISRFYIKYKFF